MSTNNENIIEVHDLVKKFGSFYANKYLTFSVSRGEIFGFLGANGAGKTTAIKILCGLSKPTSGELKVAGFDVYKETEKIKRSIGYMSQKFSLYDDLTIEENIWLYAGIYGLSKEAIKRKIPELLTELQLMEVKDMLISQIPLGWKQKLAFSVAMVHEPKIVFLDEPTSGVDPITRRQFWDLIYAAAHNGTTVFITTHYMDEAEYCDRISIMVDGEIAAMGSPMQLKKEYETTSINDIFLKLTRNG